jgi:cytoskeletal protein RodZ
LALIHKNRLSESSESPLGPPDLKVHESIADSLRLARQEHGQDLRTVAQVLRIRLAYLEAIEKGDFEQLPGTAYAIGFLRTYAEFLGLDGEQIVERFKHEAQSVEPKLDLVFPEPVGHGRIPGGAIVLISAVLLGLAYGGWFYLSNQDMKIADLMSPLPERLQALIAGDDDGQGGAAPEPALAASDGTQTATIAGTEATSYTPPEGAESDSQAAMEPMGPATAGDENTPSPAESLALSVPASVANFELGQSDVASPGAAAPTPDIPAPIPAATSETAQVIETPAPEVVATVETPAPEVVATDETPAPEAVATVDTPAPETTAEPPAPSPVPMPTTATGPELSTATGPELSTANGPELSTASGDSALAQAAAVAPTTPMTPVIPAPPVAPMSHGNTDMAGSIEPLLDETVVIPSPPTATRDMTMSADRSPRVYGESNLGTRIVLRAVADSWVQVRDRQDALLLTRVLRRGDTYYVPDQNGLTLLTGNAGGLAIEVDGVTLAPLGPLGAVRRQIALDPVRLLDGTAQR